MPAKTQIAFLRIMICPEKRSDMEEKSSFGNFKKFFMPDTAVSGDTEKLSFGGFSFAIKAYPCCVRNIYAICLTDW